MHSLATFLAGIGLLLTGINLLSDALKRTGSRAFRRFALQYMAPRWRAIALGAVSGALVQSTSAAMVILAGLNTAGGVSLGQAISILSGFSVGNCLMPFLISFNIHLAVFFLVGVTSILLYFVKDDRLRNFLGIAFGLGLIFFGIEVMLDGVRPLRTEPWFAQSLVFASHWPSLNVLVGAVLGFVVQSSTAVVVVAIGLAKGGVLSGHDVFLTMYGAAIGSTLFKTFLGAAMSGSGRQLVRFVNLFNFTGAGLFIALDRLEVATGAPIVMALVTGITAEPAMQAALAFLLLNFTTAVIFILCQDPLVAWLVRASPSTEAELLSKPRYLAAGSVEDPATALDLVALEQLRQIEQIAAFLPPLGANRGVNLQERVKASELLGNEIDAALVDVGRLPLAGDTAGILALLQTRQTLVAQLAAALNALIDALAEASRHSIIANLASACRESMEFLILHLVEGIRSGDMDMETQALLYSDRGPQMRQIREAYADAKQELTPEARTTLMSLTLSFDKCIWLLGRIAGLEDELQLRQAQR